MSSVSEHMTADATALLDESGDTVEFDGADLTCLIFDYDYQTGSMEGMIIERCQLTHLAGAISRRSTGAEVVIDGVDWTVVSVRPAGATVTYVLERVAG